MKKKFLTFLSRFRSSQNDQRRPRTMAESEVEDMKAQNADSPERKTFDEAAFEKGQKALKQPFGTSTHSGDNPSREKNP
jgi:hypothetical protein